MACHSSLVAHMEQHSHTHTLEHKLKQFNKWRSSINRSQFLFLWYVVRSCVCVLRIEIEKKREAEQQTPVKLIGTWVRNSETKTKAAKPIYSERSLDEAIENRRIQFKLIAIKSGTDSNLLNVTSHAAGPLAIGRKKCSVSAALALSFCSHSKNLSKQWLGKLLAHNIFHLFSICVCLRYSVVADGFFFV